ncbi:MAG: pyridoxal phosphate-dependent aminotransferase [Muribaculaceae bacterium]|nr:pyridoxal phosphate-dependent aminotransferase [Muribaculaceae bacterium]
MTNDKFNFDEIVDRHGTHSVKWDKCDNNDIIPMWVADMDFKAAPCIIDAMKDRLEHGIFGYANVPEEFYTSIINWFQRRHNWTINHDWIEYTTGVVPAFDAVLKAITKPGENVVVLTPVYNCFFTCIESNKCKTVEVPLTYDDNYAYTIDFKALEQALSDNNTHTLLFCNPHNPAGRVWTKDELLEVNKLCIKHGVTVISDEIHCEMMMPGYHYTPFASISAEAQNNCITCGSPSKSFNIAGLQAAFITCSNPIQKALINQALIDNQVCSINPFGLEAFMAAYNHGESWILQFNEYLAGNFNLMCDMMNKELPQFHITPIEGTYLAWINVTPTGMTSAQVTQKILDDGKVLVNDGAMYGKAGDGFIRINLATPRSLVKEATQRIINAMKQ